MEKVYKNYTNTQIELIVVMFLIVAILAFIKCTNILFMFYLEIASEHLKIDIDTLLFILNQ